jgi:hypothetical protein
MPWILKIMHKFEEVDFKKKFISLVSNLSTKDLITLGNLLLTKLLKP